MLPYYGPKELLLQRPSSKVNIWRYEVSYFRCGYKVRGYIIWFRRRMPTHLLNIISPYFSAYDAKQAFLVCIKNTRSRGFSFPGVADDRLKLGRHTGGKQIRRYDLRSRRNLPVCDDDCLPDPWRISAQRQAT